MASFRRYGNSDPDEMYPIWNFRLSLAHQQRLIFSWIDNSATLVAQSWTVLLKNPFLKTLTEPP